MVTTAEITERIDDTFIPGAAQVAAYDLTSSLADVESSDRLHAAKTPLDDDDEDEDVEDKDGSAKDDDDLEDDEDDDDEEDDDLEDDDDDDDEDDEEEDDDEEDDADADDPKPLKVKVRK